MMNLQKNWFENVDPRSSPRPGRNWLETIVWLDDIASAVDFYHQMFGLVPILMCRNDQDQLIFTRLRYRGTQLCLSQNSFDGEGMSLYQAPSSFLFYIYVDDIDETIKKMTDQGSKVIVAKQTTSWGDVRARITDPFGVNWDIVNMAS
jgi:uncharacterized glyoxalase superfamily protein PhnB